MKPLLKLVVNIYDINNRDWMNYKITKDNPLTLHHIKKKEEGGKDLIENSAPLTEKAHAYLHLIEIYDRNIYDEINSVFKSMGNPNTKNNIKIEKLMLKFEKLHSKEVIKGNKGKHKQKCLTYKRKKDQKGTYTR